ncbi:MAG: hypothetical protein NW216_08945 [Hyphomicrobium sp.]|nr:hypothetical protein [Hyphomicrobium sp.]
MNDALDIAVLVSEGRNPTSGAPRAARADVAALALAGRLTKRRVTVLHAGDARSPALADYLAYGAERIEVLKAEADDDVLPLLVDRAAAFDLIITGARAEKGAGSGVLPYALAKALERPVVANVLLAERSSERGLIATQYLPKGARRAISIDAPAVIAVHANACAGRGYAYARRLNGEIVEQNAPPAKTAPAWPGWTVTPAMRPPRKLAPVVEKDGFTRMRDAIEPKAKGGVVAFEGSSVDKAQVILNYLRQHRLVEF